MQEEIEEIEDLSDVSPLCGLCWGDIPQEMWPYTDYRDEYLRSPYALDTETLVSRWSGIFPEMEVRAFMCWPGLAEDRWAAQHTEGDPASAEFRLRLNKLQIMRFYELMENAMNKLRDGADYQFINGRKQLVPLTPRARAALLSQVEVCLKTMRLLTGESTEIVELRGLNNKVTVNQLIVDGMSRLPPSVQNIIQNSLPIGETYESRTVENV